MDSRFIRVKAANSMVLRQIMMRQSVVGRIVAGKKILSLAAHEEVIGCGELFCFERRSSWQIVQQAERGQIYAAELLLLDQADIDACTSFRPSETKSTIRRQAQPFVFHRRPSQEGLEIWQRLASADELMYADIQALLAWLADVGWCFSTGARLSCAERLERLLVAQLHFPWTQEQAAVALGLSASTLKRRLRTEQTSFARLLRQLRMEAALFLLMSRQTPIGDIAAACGYQSGGHFAAAFKQQCGFLPSDVRM